MKLDVTVEARDMIDALVDVYGDDYDTLAEFMRACATSRDIEIKSDADWHDVMAEISDDQIEAEYLERFDGGDHRDNRDMVAATAALASGDHTMARVLFDRAGRPDLGSASVAL